MMQVLYILTITTTVFIPAQFLTGLYGYGYSFDRVCQPGLTVGACQDEF